MVAMKGLLPQHSVEAPDQVLLGMCAVEDTLHGAFHIRNTRSVLRVTPVLCSVCCTCMYM